MIEEVKKIISERYKHEYQSALSEYNCRKMKILELEANLQRLENETMYPVEKKHFSWIQRNLTRRYEYKEYQKTEEEYKKTYKEWMN